MSDHIEDRTYTVGDMPINVALHKPLGIWINVIVNGKQVSNLPECAKGIARMFNGTPDQDSIERFWQVFEENKIHERLNFYPGRQAWVHE
jgi:23S rRNA A2030 N6-methylase RlmJ